MLCLKVLVIVYNYIYIYIYISKQISFKMHSTQGYFYCKNWSFYGIQSVLSILIYLEYYSDFSSYRECCASRHLF
jgi:hypothetical protein